MANDMKESDKQKLRDFTIKCQNSIEEALKDLIVERFNVPAQDITVKFKVDTDENK